MSSDGLIYPEAFWGKSRDLDTEAIRTSATNLRALGVDVSTKTDDISTVWNELPASYVSPEAWRVYTLMGPAVATADGIEDRFGQAAGHLETFADELDAIKPVLADLERRANAFRAKALKGIKTSPIGEIDGWAAVLSPGAALVSRVTDDWVTVSWKEHGPTVEENKSLLGEYFAIVEQITMSSDTCARAIRRVINPTQCVAPGEGSIGVITAEQLASAGDLPFGAPVTEDRTCVESVGAGTVTFFDGIVTGAGMLVLGYNPETGDFWDGGAYGQAWGGLGNLVGSLAVIGPGTVLAATLAPDSAVGQWAKDRNDVVVGAAGSLIGYDHATAQAGGDGWHQWKEDGVATATTSVLNIGTFFIPGAGAIGGGAKAGSVAARVGAVASTTAEIIVPGGSWLLKGGANAVRFGETAVTVARGGTAAVVDTARLSKAGVLTSLDNITETAGYTPTRPRLTDSFTLEGVSKPAPTSPGTQGGLHVDVPSNRTPGHLPENTGGLGKPAPDMNAVPGGRGSHVDASGTSMGAGKSAPEVSGQQASTGGSGKYPDAPGAHGAPSARPELVPQHTIPDTPNHPMFDPEKAKIVEAEIHDAYGENPYDLPDYVPDEWNAQHGSYADIPLPEKTPALVGAIEHEAGRIDLTSPGPGHSLAPGNTGPGHVTNSIDTTPTRTGSRPGTSGHIDTGGSGVHGHGGESGRTGGVAGGAGRSSGHLGDGPGASAGDGGGLHHGESGGSGHPGNDSSAPDGPHGPGRAPDAINLIDPNNPPGGGQGWPDPARDYQRPVVTRVVEVTGKDMPGPKTPFTTSKFVKGGLEPNTLYHVEGRGDFYTNAEGRIDYVETTYGGDTLNYDLHKPQADTTYIVHPEIRYPSEGGSYAHVFVTDGEGRTVLAHTDRLARGDGVRSEAVQARVGAEGGPDYDGGHSYGTWSGGGGEYINLDAQLREINQNYPNSFYEVEARWRALLPDAPGPHPTIEVNIHKDFEPGNPVPLEFLVEYSVDGGRWIEQVFENV